jgi:putative ABC transport system substrate-binding protein
MGWSDGRTVRIDYRWAGGNVGDIRKYAAELVALAPDAIVAGGGAGLPHIESPTLVPLSSH